MASGINDDYNDFNDDHIGIQMQPMVTEKTAMQNSVSLLPDVTRRILRGPLAPVNNFLDATEEKVREFSKNHKTILKGVFYVILGMGYLAYLIAACILNFERVRILVYITILSIGCATYWFIKKYFGDVIMRGIFEPIQIHFINRFWKIYQMEFYFFILSVRIVLDYIRYTRRPSTFNIINWFVCIIFLSGFYSPRIVAG